VELELSDDEWVVLAGLARLVVHADQEISPAEQDAMAQLQRGVGGVRWNAAVRAARRRFPTSQELERQAREGVRVEARRAIYEALADLAGSDGIVTTEASVLRWVAEEWRLG
jgi:uncharacterized tellurite resistance protein B-like protein